MPENRIQQRTPKRRPGVTEFLAQISYAWEDSCKNGIIRRASEVLNGSYLGLFDFLCLSVKLQLNVELAIRWLVPDV
jgi:hypothetical protein